MSSETTLTIPELFTKLGQMDTNIYFEADSNLLTITFGEPEVDLKIISALVDYLDVDPIDVLFYSTGENQVVATFSKVLDN